MESKLKKCLVENDLVKIKELQDNLSPTLKKNVRQNNVKEIHRDHFTEGLITDNIKKHISRDPDYTIIAGKYVSLFLIYHFFRRSMLYIDLCTGAGYWWWWCLDDGILGVGIPWRQFKGGCHSEAPPPK